jgi:hypothetical protein
MPLSRNIEDPKFIDTLEGLNHRNLFIRDLARAILPGSDGFDSMMKIANRVYDRHCAPKSGLPNQRGLDRTSRTALSA